MLFTSGRLCILEQKYFQLEYQPFQPQATYSCDKMAPSRTTTIKNKHAANKSGLKKGKNSAKPQNEGVVSKSRKPKSKGLPPKPQKRPGNPYVQKREAIKKLYSEKDLGVPELNMITPVGVQKPRGKKKGKVFVDDQVRYSWH